MNIIQSMQNFTEDHFDITLSKKQVILVIILHIVMISLSVYYFSMDKMQSDMPGNLIIPPTLNAPLFEKK